MNEIIIWGATGQAVVLHEFLPRIGYKIIALFDNDASTYSISADIPIYHEISDFNKWMLDHQYQNIFGLVAIGGSKGKDRIDIQNFLKANGIKIATAIHPSAFVSEDATIGQGCQILVNSAVCARARIEDSVIINTSASIDHECYIGKGAHVGPGAKIAGKVTIGDFSFIGTGAVVVPRIKIGSNSIIGAGSVVTKNIPDNVIAYGNPVKIIRNN